MYFGVLDSQRGSFAWCVFVWWFQESFSRLHLSVNRRDRQQHRGSPDAPCCNPSQLPASGAPATDATFHQAKHRIATGLIREHLYLVVYSSRLKCLSNAQAWRRLETRVTDPERRVLQGTWLDCLRDASNGISRLGDSFRTEQLLYFSPCILDSVPLIQTGRPVYSMSENGVRYSFCREVPMGQHLKGRGTPSGKMSTSTRF